MPLRSEAAGVAFALAPALALSLGAVATPAPAVAADRPASVRMLVQDSPLAGFRHAEAGAVWPDLREGDVVALVREPENPFDENAVRVEWQGRKLGYVPRRDNAALAWALDRGEVLHARISRAEWHPNPARRITFQVFVE